MIMFLLKSCRKHVALEYFSFLLLVTGQQEPTYCILEETGINGNVLSPPRAEPLTCVTREHSGIPAFSGAFSQGNLSWTILKISHGALNSSWCNPSYRSQCKTCFAIYCILSLGLQKVLDQASWLEASRLYFWCILCKEKCGWFLSRAKKGCLTETSH